MKDILKKSLSRWASNWGKQTNKQKTDYYVSEDFEQAGITTLKSFYVSIQGKYLKEQDEL